WDLGRCVAQTPQGARTPLRASQAAGSWVGRTRKAIKEHNLVARKARADRTLCCIATGQRAKEGPTERNVEDPLRLLIDPMLHKDRAEAKRMRAQPHRIDRHRCCPFEAIVRVDVGEALCRITAHGYDSWRDQVIDQPAPAARCERWVPVGRQLLRLAGKILQALLQGGVLHPDQASRL